MRQLINVILELIVLIYDIVRLTLAVGLAFGPFLFGMVWGCMMTGAELGYDLTYRRR